MKIVLRPSSRGIALIVVMIAIFVLAAIAGAFAFAMKVETILARNSNNETDDLWKSGLSGVEAAKWVLAMENCPYSDLNQKWAGGPGEDCETNGPLADVSLDPFRIGDQTYPFSIKITDLERKFNINVANEIVLQQALNMVGADASEIPSITDSILDWIDPDDNPRINGAESDYYRSLNPPYFAKNGPIDDLSELLLVHGIAEDQDIYWGPASTNHSPASFQRRDRFGRPMDAPLYPVGLVDLFTPISSGKINPYTASTEVLQLVPGIDETIAEGIIKLRPGPNGADGTGIPAGAVSIQDLLRSAGLSNQGVMMASQFFTPRSATFQVEVTISGSHRKYYAILGENNPRDIQVLSFYWKDE